VPWCYEGGIGLRVDVIGIFGHREQQMQFILTLDVLFGVGWVR
jgi:hypothetical protein